MAGYNGGIFEHGSGYTPLGGLGDKAGYSVPRELSALAATGTSGRLNVDHVNIQGGVKVGGGDGYTLAGLGFPQSKCSAFNLWVRPNVQYAIGGWSGVAPNPNALSTYPAL